MRLEDGQRTLVARRQGRAAHGHHRLAGGVTAHLMTVGTARVVGPLPGLIVIGGDAPLGAGIVLIGTLAFSIQKFFESHRDTTAAAVETRLARAGPLVRTSAG